MIDIENAMAQLASYKDLMDMQKEQIHSQQSKIKDLRERTEFLQDLIEKLVDENNAYREKEGTETKEYAKYMEELEEKIKNYQ